MPLERGLSQPGRGVIVVAAIYNGAHRGQLSAGRNRYNIGLYGTIFCCTFTTKWADIEWNVIRMSIKVLHRCLIKLKKLMSP